MTDSLPDLESKWLNMRTMKALLEELDLQNDRVIPLESSIWPTTLSSVALQRFAKSEAFILFVSQFCIKAVDLVLEHLHVYL